MSVLSSIESPCVVVVVVVLEGKRRVCWKESCLVGIRLRRCLVVDVDKVDC